MAPRFLSARYCRNGVFGAGYHLIQMREGAALLVAAVFDAEGHVAVFDSDGQPWRCEDFEPALRRFLETGECRRMCWPDQAGALPANDHQERRA